MAELTNDPKVLAQAQTDLSAIIELGRNKAFTEYYLRKLNEDLERQEREILDGTDPVKVAEARAVRRYIKELLARPKEGEAANRNILGLPQE